MEDLKLCKDCRFASSLSPLEFTWAIALHFCNRPGKIDLVTGKSTASCESERNPSIIRRLKGNCCGKEGRFFEKKESK